MLNGPVGVSKQWPDGHRHHEIDIGKKVFHVVAVKREGAVIQRAKFARDTLQSFFDLTLETLICMEVSTAE